MNSARGIAARNAEIMDHPPRVVVEPTDEVLAPARELLGKISGAASGQSGPTVPSAEPPRVPDLLLTGMCHRELFERMVDLSLQLLKSPTLLLRDRQLAILRVGWLQQIPYIWGEHVVVSKKLGLSDRDIGQVIEGSASLHWSAHERALLTAVEELLANAMISDGTWAQLAISYNEQQLFELPILVGQFSTVGYLQNALRIPLAPSNPGLAAR